MELFETQFTTLDWGIVVTYLIVSIVVGVVANKYVGSLSGYLVAGRTLRIRLALATMTGTEIGLVTVMYVAELGFVQQYASLYLALYESAILLAIGLTGFVVYRLRESGVMTIPEFYQQRYSRRVRVVGGIMMVLSGVLNMALFLKAGALFLVAITGLEAGVGLKLIMTGLLLLVLFYTVLGGMVSVVITDLIQFVVLGLGMLLVTGFVLNEIGLDGFEKAVAEHNAYVDPTVTDNPSQESHKSDIGPLKLLSQAVILSVALMLWPAGVSRTLAVKTPEIARQLYLWSSIPFLARRTLPCLWGIGAFVFFSSRPELFAELNAQDGATQMAMPLFLAKIIPAGLIGIVTAGMIAAFMSTHDSYLLCWSGVIAQDIVAPLRRTELSERGRILVTRVSIVGIGAMLLLWGLWYEVGSDLWQYMAVTGTIYLSGVLPVVVGGLYWKRASSTGAMVALCCGVSAILALDPCVNRLNSLLESLGSTRWLRPDHVVMVSFAISLSGFFLGSILKPDPDGGES